MAGSSHAAVTPAGIRDGDPAALAALVERRANAVLAYCETVLPSDDAEQSAAEAFARFRAAVATAADPRSLDPETLLLGATRHAAADWTPAPVPEPGGSGLRRLLQSGRGASAETCAQIPGLLAGRAEGALGDADLERLTRHLERHAPCGALAERAARAERAYATPPERTVPTGALTEILLALTAAAPVLILPDDSFDFGIDLDELPPPTYVHASAGPDASSRPELDEEPEFDDEPELDREPVGVAVITSDATDPSEAVVEDHGPGGQTELMPAVAAIESGRGIPHPRPPRRQLQRPSAPAAHGVLYRFLLPGALAATVLLIVLVAAGFFRADPAPDGGAATTSTLPAAPPPGAPPVSSAPSTTRTPAQDAAVRRAATAARKAREAKAAAARRKAAEEAPTTTGGSPETTGQAPPAAASPAPAAGGSDTPARDARAPTRPSPTTAGAQKPAGGTAEQQPAESSSALPGGEPNATPTETPGVFEGTTP